MSTIEKAISAVRDAEIATEDLMGNMQRAMFLIERVESVDETIQNLEWASSNLDSAKWRIRDALEAVRAIKEATP